MDKYVRMSELQIDSLMRRGFRPKEFMPAGFEPPPPGTCGATSSSPEAMRDKAASLVAQAKVAEQQAAEKARALKAAEQAKAKALAAKTATLTRLNYHIELAAATAKLLDYLKQSVTLGNPVMSPIKEFVQFRKELAPLAKAYGYGFVAVGDGSSATLVKN